MSFRRHAPRVDRVLLGLGVICFCAFLTEGALADWSAVWLHDKAHASESLAALGYAVFAGAMTTMRMVGDRLLEAFGSVRLLRLFTALGAAALAAALLLARVDGAMIAFVLLGLGMATVVPTAFAAAGRRADALAGGAAGEASAARAVALLSGFGYTRPAARAAADRLARAGHHAHVGAGPAGAARRRDRGAGAAAGRPRAARRRGRDRASVDDVSVSGRSAPASRRSTASARS